MTAAGIVIEIENKQYKEYGDYLFFYSYIGVLFKTYFWYLLRAAFRSADAL